MGLTIVLGALTAFGPMSIDTYLPALPALAQSLSAHPGQVELTLSGFFLGFGAGQMVYGPLSDRWGRRPPLLIATALYIAASAGCAAAARIETLIAVRAVQGLAACAGPLIARAAARDLYGREHAARMLSWMTLVMSAAPLLAPFLGGQLLLAFGWRAIFAALTAFGALCFLAAWLGLPETLPPGNRSGENLTGILRRFGTLLGSRPYLGYTLASGAAYAGMFAYFAGSPFVFIGLYHVPPARYAVLFALNVVGLMICAVLNARLVLRCGPDRLLACGTASAAGAGIVLAALAAGGWGGLAGLVIPIMCFIASISFIGGNALAGALSLFPGTAGTASAVAGLLQFSLGAASGAAVGALTDGTARPMAGVIAASGLASLLAHRLLIRPARQETAVPAAHSSR